MKKLLFQSVISLVLIWSPSVLAGDPLISDAETSLSRISQSLINMQHPSGEWVGVVEADPTADLMPIFLAQKLGLSNPQLMEQTLDRIFKRQDPSSGLWPEYPGGPFSADVTAMLVMGLQYTGFDMTDLRVARAWKWFNQNGKEKNLGILNKMIATFGELIPASSMPVVSPKFFAIPFYTPINLKSMGFGRTGVIPEAVWRYYHDVIAGVNEAAGELDPARLRSGGDAFGDEWAAPISLSDPWYHLWHGDIGLISLFEDTLPTSADFWAQEGLGWILKQQQPDGTWAGALQITYFCMLALHEAQLAGIGHFDAQIQNAWDGLMKWRAEIPGNSTIQQSTVGPVMDTARILTAFAQTPERLSLLPVENNARASFWLIQEKIKQQNPAQSAWTFEYENADYPDCDDSGMVIQALSSYPDPASTLGEVREGVEWLKTKQNSDGGFPAWDRGTSRLFHLITTVDPSAIPDVSDVSQGDITSRVIMGLVASHADHKMIQHACRFLLHHRRTTSESSLSLWQGEWLVAYAYGTAQATEALLTADCWSASDALPYIQWLISKQNPDGGWGESPESYVQEKFVTAPSTLTQSEFVLMALIRYQNLRQPGSFDALPAIEAGIRYLVDRIGESSVPAEDEFTGVYVRQVWYGRYLMLPHYEAVRVLGAYLTLKDQH